MQLQMKSRCAALPNAGVVHPDALADNRASRCLESLASARQEEQERKALRPDARLASPSSPALATPAANTTPHLLRVRLSEQ